MLLVRKNCSFKQALLGGLSIVALTSMLAISGFALAAPTELDDGVDVTATNKEGLMETDASADVTVTIDATAKDLEFGRVGSTPADAVLIDNANVLMTTLTLDLDIGANRFITFQNDIDPDDRDVVINILGGTANFLGM